MVKQSYAKAMAEGLRCGGSAQERFKSLLRQKGSIQEVQIDSAMRTPSSVLQNPPSSPIVATLPPPHREGKLSHHNMGI